LSARKLRAASRRRAKSIRWARTLWITAALAAFVGCTLFPPAASQEEKQAYAAAEAARAKDPKKGRAALERFLERYPDSALAPEAELGLGDLARKAGRNDEAKRRYMEVVRRGGASSDRARVQLAAIELERGDASAARGWLDRVRLSKLERGDLRNAYRVFAETSSRPADRMRWLALLRAEVTDPAEATAIDSQIDRLLGDLPVSELELAARQVGDRPSAGPVYVALAERALIDGKTDQARDAVEKARAVGVAPRYAARLASVEAHLGRSEAAPPSESAELPKFRDVMDRSAPDFSSARGAIGVVLPLSGPFAGFGEQALRGVLLAAGIFPGEGARRAEVRIAVRDSGSDPERAVAAVRELAADPEVVAIVGPLVSATCEAAAREAESRGVPLLALTAREDVTNQRRWVFRVRTRPVEEADLVAERAVALGAKRFAILYPDDPYGVGLRGLFWDAVEARGGRVVAVASFDPKATDFGAAVKRLVGYSLLDAEEKSLLATRDGMLERARRLPTDQARELRVKARSLTTRDGRPIPPIVDFDALFIPASHEDLVLIAPQLAYHEVTGARLLGAEGWYDPQLARLGGAPLEGSLFAAHFYPDSEVPYVRAFRQRFEATFESVPDAFAAQGYDAAGLALVQIARHGDDREDVRDGLHETESYPGISGVITIGADGNAHKRPYLLGIEHGRVVQFTD
jgi:ABC-type branched-subunit amino acid transport system substrate-binding protein